MLLSVRRRCRQLAVMDGSFGHLCPTSAHGTPLSESSRAERRSDSSCTPRVRLACVARSSQRRPTTARLRPTGEAGAAENGTYATRMGSGTKSGSSTSSGYSTAGSTASCNRWTSRCRSSKGKQSTSGSTSTSSSTCSAATSSAGWLPRARAPRSRRSSSPRPVAGKASSPSSGTKVEDFASSPRTHSASNRRRH